MNGPVDVWIDSDPVSLGPDADDSTVARYAEALGSHLLERCNREVRVRTTQRASWAAEDHCPDDDEIGEYIDDLHHGDGWLAILDEALAPRRVSIDNGRTLVTAADISDSYLAAHWDALVNVMDDDAREQAHDDLAPCDNRTFLARYLELAECDLVIG